MCDELGWCLLAAVHMHFPNPHSEARITGLVFESRILYFLSICFSILGPVATGSDDLSTSCTSRTFPNGDLLVQVGPT